MFSIFSHFHACLSYLLFPCLTYLKGTAPVRSTSSLHHFLVLLVVIVLRGREGRRDRGRKRGWGFSSGSLFSSLAHLPDPHHLHRHTTWQAFDPCSPGRVSHWLSVSCLADWQDIHNVLGPQSKRDCKSELTMDFFSKYCHMLFDCIFTK